MHLKKVTLRNFRCFDSLEVELHPRLTVFVAENGGGKTSVLDGIAVGLSPILGLLSSANQRLSGPGIKDTDFRLLPTDKRIELKAPFAQVVVENTAGWRWDEWKPSEQGGVPPEKAGQTSLNPLLDVLKSYATETVGLLPVFAYYGAQRGLVEIPKRLREKQTKVENYNYPTSGLYGALDAQSNFKEALKWFDTEETSEWREQKESEEPVKSVALDTVRSALSEVLGEAYYDPHFDSKHKFSVRTKLGPKKLQVSQLSQGYQSMLALGMDFARRLALANRHLSEGNNGAQVWNDALGYYRRWHSVKDEEELDFITRGPALAPAIMLVDEIDVHLHPSWQQRVLGDLMRAFPHTQFIVTTHSPQVLTTVKSENIRVLGRNAAGVWEALPPPQEIKGVESTVALNKVMGVNPIPPVDEAKWLTDYVAHIENGTHTTPDAVALRDKLSNLYGPTHPVMLDVERLVRFQAFKLRKGTSPQP